MNIYHRLAKLLEHKPDGDRWTFVNGPLPTSFLGTRDDGKTVLNYLGENYVPMKLSIRVRLHNWFIYRGNRLISSDSVYADKATSKDG